MVGEIINNDKLLLIGGKTYNNNILDLNEQTKDLITEKYIK